ncbi:MAG TPA: TetR/AcrR family transcriptional regulator [Sediminibacterium sp.]|nr:TetR/AcrR family transcriptional regulator [Sediminibacterium sp.]
MAQDQKQEQIIEAAIKRFAHFGVGKTTMNEIAGDLSISKALLYYYFPDKNSLYAAVLLHIFKITSEQTNQLLEKEQDPVKMMHIFLQRRTEYIIKYYNIVEFLKRFNQANLPKNLQELFSHLRQKELNRITAIIEKGRQQKVFQIKDVEKTAELYHDFLEGYRTSFFSQHPSIFPEKEQFLAILEKEKAFSEIFFKGLSS